jgi:hypothetical protein
MWSERTSFQVLFDVFLRSELTSLSCHSSSVHHYLLRFDGKIKLLAVFRHSSPRDSYSPFARMFVLVAEMLFPPSSTMMSFMIFDARRDFRVALRSIELEKSISAEHPCGVVRIGGRYAAHGRLVEPERGYETS